MSVALTAGNFLWGYGQVITKRHKNLDAYQIVLNAGIVFTFISTMAYCAAGQYKFTMQKFGICLVVVGIPTFFSLSLTIMSVKMVRETGLVMILMYTSVILGYLMSVFYYN